VCHSCARRVVEGSNRFTFFVWFFVPIVKMRNPIILLWLCLAASTFRTSVEYDGLINALTRVFAHKHVQTVTATTCWPTGEIYFYFCFVAAVVFENLNRNNHTDIIYYTRILRTTFYRRKQPTTVGAVVGRHIGQFPSVPDSSAQNLVQIWDFGRRVLQCSDPDAVISEGILLLFYDIIIVLSL